MSVAERTLADLLANIFPDSPDPKISSQNLRDAIVSTFGGHIALYGNGEEFSKAASYTGCFPDVSWCTRGPVTPYKDSGGSEIFTLDSSNTTIRVNVAGTYLIGLFNLYCLTGAAGNTALISLAMNTGGGWGVHLDSYHILHAWTGTGVPYQSYPIIVEKTLAANTFLAPYCAITVPGSTLWACPNVFFVKRLS